jgi:hypothetical protein
VQSIKSARPPASKNNKKKPKVCFLNLLTLSRDKRVYRQPGCSGYWMHDQIYIKIGILVRR